jgi:hypothetical protein
MELVDETIRTVPHQDYEQQLREIYSPVRRERLEHLGNLLLCHRAAFAEAARLLSLLAFLNLDDIFLDLFRPDISSTAWLEDGGLSWQAETLLVAIRLSRLSPHIHCQPSHTIEASPNIR